MNYITIHGGANEINGGNKFLLEDKDYSYRR